jgi:hypothetical protein
MSVRHGLLFDLDFDRYRVAPLGQGLRLLSRLVDRITGGLGLRRSVFKSWRLHRNGLHLLAHVCVLMRKYLRLARGLKLPADLAHSVELAPPVLSEYSRRNMRGACGLDANAYIMVTRSHMDRHL